MILLASATYAAARDVVVGILAAAVVALVRLSWRLGSRLTRLEAIEEERRRLFRGDV